MDHSDQGSLLKFTFLALLKALIQQAQMGLKDLDFQQAPSENSEVQHRNILLDTVSLENCGPFNPIPLINRKGKLEALQELLARGSP
jgi:hypothetical protein